MKTKPDADNYRLRMDAKAWPGEMILNRAMDEGRALTATEDAGVTLAEVDRDIEWMDWIVAARRAGVRISDWDQEYVFGSYRNKSSNGLRLESKFDIPTLFVYGDIGEADLTAVDFEKKLAMVPDTATMRLRFFSYGGDYWESMAMYSLVRSRVGKTIGVVDSVAGSGASIILMACNEIEMTTGSWIMIHGVQATLASSRTAQELQDAADLARKSNEQLFDVYRPRWNKSDAELRASLSTDTWFDEKDAIAVGLADRISDSPAMAAHVTTRNLTYKNTPQTVMLAASVHRDRIQLRRRLVGLRMHRACVH